MNSDMYYKDPFDVFDEVKIKEKKRYHSLTGGKHGIDHIIKGTFEFEFIPPEAFEEISGYSLYNNLKEGLFVQKRLLYKTTLLEEILEDMNLVTHFSKGIETIGKLTLHNARKIAKDLNAQIMTPGEYFCVIKYLRKDKKKNEEMLMNMLHNGSEYLDAVMREDGCMKIRPKFENDRFKEGYHAAPLVEWSDYSFNIDDVDNFSGFPFKHDKFGKFHFWSLAKKRSGDLSVQRTCIKGAIPNIMSALDADDCYDSSGIRLSYPIEVEEELG